MWNLDALRESKEIILCEALIDALTFWCAGIRNVTTSYGVGGFTSEHLEAFRSYGIEHVLIAYDRDDAGDRAADALAKRLLAAGIGVSRIEFPKRHGRERVRVEGNTGEQGARHRDPQSRVVGQRGRALGGTRSSCAGRVRRGSTATGGTGGIGAIGGHSDIRRPGSTPAAIGRHRFLLSRALLCCVDAV